MFYEQFTLKFETMFRRVRYTLPKSSYRHSFHCAASLVRILLQEASAIDRLAVAPCGTDDKTKPKHVLMVYGGRSCAKLKAQNRRTRSRNVLGSKHCWADSLNVMHMRNVA